MVDKITFMETLRSVAEITKTSHEPLSREEVLQYFENMELSKEQQDMVYQYLLTPEIEETNEEVIEQPSKEESYIEEPLTKEAEVKTETLSDSDFFKMYLEDIKDLKELSKAEMDVMYGRLLSGDEAVIQTISDNWLRRVLEIAKQYTSRNANMEDVIQEGNMGLLYGISNLLGSRECNDVEGYLTQSIKESMEAFIDEMMGEEDWETTVVAKVTLIHEARKALTEELGRVPSQTELSQFTKIPEEEIKDILELYKEKEK